MQTEVQKLSPQSDAETRERIKTAIELSGYRAVRSMKFRIEQGVVDIRGRFPSFYLCQVAIKTVKHVPGVVRVMNHSEVVYDLIPHRESVESDVKSKPHIQSIVEPPAYSRSMVLSSFYEKVTSYAGAVIHD